MRINYIYKKESDIDKFTANNSAIELKEYMDDLILYSPLNSNFRAEYALYDKIAYFDKAPDIYTGGSFGSYLKIKDKFSFNIKNFDPITKEARISFWVSPNKIIESSKIALIPKENFPEEGLPAGDYSINVQVEGQPNHSFVFKIKEGSNVNAVKNKMFFKLEDSYNFSINTANTENKILLQSSVPGKRIQVFDGVDGNNLLEYFDAEQIEYGSAPETPIEFFKLFNFSITHFKNTKTGEDKSYLRFKIKSLDNENEDDIVEIPWNTDSVRFDNIEVDFDGRIMYVFINGKLEGVKILDNKFINNGQTLELYGTEENIYSFDEIIINKKYKHTKDFETAKTQLTKYTTEKPYIDYYFSEVKKGMKFNSLNYNNIYCCLCDNGNFYYYNNGAWRSCGGFDNHLNDFATFASKIETYDFSSDNFFIRCYFISDGLIKAFIDTPYFEISNADVQDEDGNTAAILIGTKEWSNENGESTKEDLANKELIIETDQGTTSIIFPEKEISEETTNEDEKLYSINDTVEYINSYYPDGIAECSKDSKERVYLISETKGKEAYIKVNGEAAPIIFGGDISEANGTDKNDKVIDYSKFYDAVRTYTGSPLISMEISDEQMNLYMKEALYYYKKWKGNNINQYTCQLKGDYLNGYEIPNVIEQQSDIVDIIFKPIFPITFYGSDFIDNGNENIFALTFANYLLGGRGTAGGFGNISQDYYVSLMSLQDFKQALGLNPTWEVINGRIFIYPNRVSRFTNVCIRYKAPLSEEEALKNPDIIKYVHGKCLMGMSLIRSQYNGNLTTGETGLTFDNTWYEKGKVLVDAVIENWKKEQPPLGFFFG